MVPYLEIAILVTIFVLGVVLLWTKRNETVGGFLIGIVVGAVIRGLIH